VSFVDKGVVRVHLRGESALDFTLDPPNGRLELALSRDGVPVAARQVLVGEYGLPLLEGPSPAVLDGTHLAWMDARRPPPLGENGEILLWRDHTDYRPSPVLPGATASTSSEVAGMMRRWGYAQPTAGGEPSGKRPERPEVEGATADP
jgi:hypothetical protein